MNSTGLDHQRNDLSVSIVVYHPDERLLASTLASLQAACEALADGSARPVGLTIVDNGGAPAMDTFFAPLRAAGIQCNVISGQGNVGYGGGHNLAIAAAQSRYHLVLNPDVELQRDSLVRALAFLEQSQETGLLAPWIGGVDGHQQYLCRRFPTVLDLFVRGFLPSSLRKPFARRLAHYEMRDQLDASNVVWDPPIISGCFMLFRTDVLAQLGGFDDRYFLYFEDYDLSLRAHDVARVAYVPQVRILHHGGGASRKGMQHVKLFVTSACRFFNRFGWKWL
ncbi:GT2 family glycosyltransferase [Paraburkholderia sp. GAS199]|uniref:glycosyltransferase n=1 Tax=Paraburkholderia sp. GAS199 TaxID=3035126 RepID=UPI003D22AA98